MMWHSTWCSRPGLIVGALAWTAPFPGSARPPKAPDEARLQEAKQLKGDYERLDKEGKYANATPLAQQVCAILEEEYGQISLEVASCINDLGRLYKSQGSFEAAESLYKHALDIGEKGLGPYHPDVAAVLNNLAMLYQAQGAYTKAEPLLERALAIGENASGLDHPDVATVLNNLATLHQAQGAYVKAARLFERALAICEKTLGPYHPHTAVSLDNLGGLRTAQGMYAKAEPLLERALAIREENLGPDHLDVALSLNNLGALHHLQGAYGRAEPLHKRALAILEKALGPDHPDVARSLNNLGALCQFQGAYEEAELLHKRALAIREKALGPHHPRVAWSLNSLADLYRARGAYEEAESLLLRALTINEKTFDPDHPHVSRTLATLASLYAAQGAYAKAEPLYERALAIGEKALGLEHPDVAHSLKDLARLYTAQGAYAKAEPLYERALAILETALGADHPHVAAGLYELAALYNDQGNHDASLSLHRRAFEIEETNLDRTLAFAVESRRFAYASSLSGSLHHIMSLHLRIISEHDGVAQLALTTMLRRKNRIQDLLTQSNDVLRRSIFEPNRPMLDDLADIDSRIAILSERGTSKISFETLSQQLAGLQQQRDRLWTELTKHNAVGESLRRPITIRDVQRTLAIGYALVELVLYAPRHNDAGKFVWNHEAQPPPRYAAYILFRDRFDWVDLGPAGPIDEHIEAFRRALQTRQAIPTDLYDAVIRPIVEKLGSARHLIIAPAGDLSLIPFGALHDGKQYLIEQYDLRYVTTGRDLLAPPATPPVTTTPVTIVANPTGADLPDAKLEADFLASLFPKSRVLLDAQATETNVRTIERPLVLHMATHGFFGDVLNERDNPLFHSGLYLADIDQVEVDRERDDGQLTAYEVSGMDLRGTQLVVLSACETGMGATVKAEGKELMSEGVAGLRRAFAMAGARTTVMSLWEVSGVTTQKTMEAYYRKLAEGMGRGEAMQAVQREMLRSEEHAHPKDWAAFIVSGDDTPMVFPEGDEPRVQEPEQPGPPPVRRRAGCVVAALSSDGDPSVPWLLLGLLGLGALRRRRV